MSQYATIQNNLIAAHHILTCKARAIVQSKNALPHCTYKCDRAKSWVRCAFIQPMLLNLFLFNALLYNQCH